MRTDLPGLEGAQVLEEQRGEVLGHLGRDLAELLLGVNLVAHLLKGRKHWRGGSQQLGLELAHGLEDVGRAVNDHVGREEDPDVDLVRRKRPGRGSVAEGAQQMEPLQAGLGDRDHRLLAEVEHEGVEAARRQCSETRA